jgi:hypothetical protein
VFCHFGEDHGPHFFFVVVREAELILRPESE